MKKTHKVYFSILIYLSITKAFALNGVGYSPKTKPVEGHAPYMTSIGGYQDLNDRFIYDLLAQPVTFVGATLHVPSFICDTYPFPDDNNLLIPPFFKYSDQDGDACAYEQIHNVKWYILDSGDKNWFSITSWDELNAVEITNEQFPGSILPPNPNSPSKFSNALVIPEAALNKRIGFVYTPISHTGLPKFGPPIKVWDLNYYWGQQPNNIGITINESNVGERLLANNDFSGGGIVKPNYQKPEIINLRIEGTFMPGERMKAEYEFLTNNAGALGDYSRFWWGEKNTISQATIDNPTYSLENISPIITDYDVGHTLEVSVLPITFIEPYIMLVGQAVTSPQIFHKPFIRNLIVDSPIKLRSQPSATYEYDYLNATPGSDVSTYSWQLIDFNNSKQELLRGTITQSGLVDAGPRIELDYNGKILRLVMQPEDINSTRGDEVFADAEIERIVGLEVITYTPTLIIGKSMTSALRASGNFSMGSIGEVTHLGEWESTDPDLIIDINGIASLSPAANTDKEVTVNFTYRNLTASLIITILTPESAAEIEQ
ncbi:hypothetical protein [Thorsellia anophelis]|uniref:Uncharacterized protein n=1 Tax=Thorsellia anophelis DSM 18579 TaxID=1123402 RepID=A0A1I0DM14_9GAMM|nr:hypothetical protein [Thorsellia anophelis]SET32725.1 hypothetical protein SAMN02583745_02020 [Thorsellia anophelis DSM 18579]